MTKLKAGMRLFELGQPHSRSLVQAGMVQSDQTVEAGKPEAKTFGGKEVLVSPCTIEGRRLYILTP